MSLTQLVAAGFTAAFQDEPDLFFRAPGRVNLIGEHTDYNDGYALPAAISGETQVAIKARDDKKFRVKSIDFDEEDHFDIIGLLQSSALGGWRNYVRGTVAVLAQGGFPIKGADITIGGSIPQGTGLSSSASLEVVLVHAQLAMIGEDVDPVKVALLAQSAESGFVGVRCGNLDQLASAGTSAGSALLIDCRTLDLQQIPMPKDCAIMIVQSGVPRGLVDGEYNARREECESAAEILGVKALRDADMTMLKAKKSKMSDVVFRRARHVISENARTLAAAAALRAGDLVALGALMVEAHTSQRDDFEITVPQTDQIAEIMNTAIGGQGGARQTGGGFGGAVVGIMPMALTDVVRAAVLAGYATPTGETPMITIETAQQGAGSVEPEPEDLAPPAERAAVPAAAKEKSK